MTQPLTTDQIEELFQEEFPCGGISTAHIARKCQKAAVVRCVGHVCTTPLDSSHLFKCMECWQVLYAEVVEAIAQAGAVRCLDCNQLFRSASIFADYRPL